MTIERSLKGLGFEGVSGVRQTRVFEFDLATSDRTDAEAEARAMCERLLANPVIESYRVSVAD